MNRNVKSIILKFALSLFLLTVIMFFMVAKGSAEMYVCIITAVIDLIICIIVYFSMRKSDKRNQ